MKKGLLYVVLAGVLLTGCNNKDKADDSKKDSKGQNDIKYEYLSKIKKSDKVDNIKRVRDEIEEDISELATGKYVNLYKGDFDVVFTENDELHVLDVKQKDEYLYGEELKNRLEHIISCAKEGMNYEAKSEEFMFSMNMISSDDYNEISLSKENLDKIANGKYNDYFSGMVYFLGNSETDACFQSTPDYRAVFVGGNYLTDKGYDSIIESQYAFNDNKNKECIYKYSEKANQSLKMISGEKTIKELIEECETLVNKEDLFKRDNVLPKEVEKVYPVDLGDGNYALHCTMRRIYDGVVFDAEEYPGNVYYDSMNAFLADIGVIDHYFNYTGEDDITDVETIDAIVPLEYALTALSDRVQGEDYTVNAIELIYRLKDTTDTEDETDYYGVPYWKIIVKAEDSNRERSYYIDALSGKIDF